MTPRLLKLQYACGHPVSGVTVCAVDLALAAHLDASPACAARGWQA